MKYQFKAEKSTEKTKEVQITYKKTFAETMQYLAQTYEVEKQPFWQSVFRFAVSNSLAVVYSRELSEVAKQSGLEAMQRRLAELEEEENNRGEKQLKFEMFRLPVSKKNKSIYDRRLPQESYDDIYVLFESLSESFCSNCQAVENELWEFRGREIIKAFDNLK